MALFRKFFHKKPPDGLVEMTERVYVFDSCFKMDIVEEVHDNAYVKSIVSQLQANLPDTSSMVFNFHEGQNQSQLNQILSEYDITVVNYPRSYVGYPLIALEMLHRFLRSCENWLSAGQQNVILMHCDRGGWPLLAFMISSLLIYRNQGTGEQKTLEMILKKGPRESVHLMTSLNPFPSQWRYLHYVSSRNVDMEWPPLDKTLLLDYITLGAIPERRGYCPVVRLYGRDLSGSRNPKLLFSTPTRSDTIPHYKQVDSEAVKIDVRCCVRGDIVVECINLDDDLKHEEMIFRVMFNTAFIRANVLILNHYEIDTTWKSTELFPMDFGAEFLFSDTDVQAQVGTSSCSAAGQIESLSVETFANVGGISDHLEPENSKAGRGLNVVKQAAISTTSKGNLATASGELGSDLQLASISTKPVALQNLTVDSEPSLVRPKNSTPTTLQKSELPLGPVIDVNLVKTRVQNSNLLPALQQSCHPKIISPRIPPSFRSSKSFYGNSFQRSPRPILRYQNAVSSLGISAVLDDHAAESREATHNVASSPSSSAANGECVVASTVPSSTPPSQALSTESALQHAEVSNITTSPSPPPQSIGSFLQYLEVPSSLEAHVTRSSLQPAPVMATSAAPLPPPSQPLFSPPSSLSSRQPVEAPLTLRTTVPQPLAPQPPSPLLALTPETVTSHVLPPIPIPPPLPPPPTSLQPPKSSRRSASETFLSLVAPPSPPPPPPPPPLPKCSYQSNTKGHLSLATPPLPPPPPPPLPKCSFPSNTKGPLSLETLTKPPPRPPPPPPSLSRSTSEYCLQRIGVPTSDSKEPPSVPPPPPPPPPLATTNSSPTPPRPPPPPLFMKCTSSAAGTVLSNIGSTGLSVVPKPPPPPRIAPKDNVFIAAPKDPSIPPPAPPIQGLPKSPNSCLSNHTAKSNGCVPPVPGAPVITKERAPLRFPSKNQGQSKKTSLKPYHWLKLSRIMQGSVWADAQRSEEDNKTPEFDISELENLFAACTLSPKDGNVGGKSNRRTSGPKSDRVQLIELQRANNCGIMLSKVKIPLHDLMSSVLALDDSALDIDQVENLIKFCPKKEEMELLEGYKGDKEKLGKCEQFFLELMKVPRVESKLRVFSFKIQFCAQVSDLRSNLNIVNSVSEEIRSSVKLKRIMQSILTLGNVLNQGTARGSAVGFRLDSLLKLTDTRARNSRMTLMHYLCKVLAEKLPELLDFPKDLASLEASTKIQLKLLAEEMQAISKGLEKVVHELQASERDGPVSESFCMTLKEFLAYAEGEVRPLASLYSIVGRNADALAIYFGEDPVRCPFEQVVSTLLTFVRLFVRAHKENCKQAEYEKKKKAQKESRK